MADRHRYVVCYDIIGNRRRARLATCLDGYGDRMQDSVFEAFLDQALFDKMVQHIKQHILPDQDSVLIYPLCAKCSGKVKRIGTPRPVPGEEKVYVV
ncbi:MAG: CRISPR-associated endonuclease Cas2 [Magnetococcales bacterium]|nr:CRISPR-associated endonuclease Cas2 [Magnetococcales bacterium]